MAKLAIIQLSAAALIGGMLRRPEEGPITCPLEEAEGIEEAGQGEIVETVKEKAPDAPKPKPSGSAPSST